MRDNKNHFNAIRNRKTGNILVSHEVGGKTIYFWIVMTADGVISVKNNAGYLLRKEDWDYMQDSKRGNGIKVNYPVTKDLYATVKRSIDFENKRRSAKSRFNKENQKKIVKKNNSSLTKKTFGDLQSLQELKKKLEMAG